MKKKQEEIIMIDGTEYYFNLDRIFEIITLRPEKISKEKEVIDNYEYSELSETRLSTKVVRELTSPNNTQYDNIRYDLIKTFIIQLITYSEKTILVGPKGAEVEVPVTNMNFAPLGTRIVFNTLVEEGILIKKEKEI